MKRARLDNILNVLKRNASVTVNELALHLQVSKETLRRDLRQLQSEGEIIRQHGKARIIIPARKDNGLAFSERFRSHAKDKIELVQQAIDWITPGMFVILDASSTCWHLSKQLPDIPITLLTNSFRICSELEKKQNIEIICTGGRLDRKHGSFVDESPLHYLKHQEVDLFIFSCDGIDVEGNIWDTDNNNALLKKIALKKAQHSILLIDKSKVARRGEITLGNICDITTVIKSDTQK